MHRVTTAMAVGDVLTAEIDTARMPGEHAVRHSLEVVDADVPASAKPSRNCSMPNAARLNWSSIGSAPPLRAGQTASISPGV
ncbi:hypothetical protein OHR68_03090 [Spirillospora sp. NBC_00431]